jgi:hypothetical protein
MPSNPKALTVKLREKHKRDFQNPKEAINKVADLIYFSTALPYLNNKALDIVNTTPLTGVFVLNTGDLCTFSPHVGDTLSCGKLVSTELVIQPVMRLFPVCSRLVTYFF